MGWHEALQREITARHREGDREIAARRKLEVRLDFLEFVLGAAGLLLLIAGFITVLLRVIE